MHDKFEIMFFLSFFFFEKISILLRCIISRSYCQFPCVCHAIRWFITWELGWWEIMWTITRTNCWAVEAQAYTGYTTQTKRTQYIQGGERDMKKLNARKAEEEIKRKWFRVLRGSETPVWRWLNRYIHI